MWSSDTETYLRGLSLFDVYIPPVLCTLIVKSPVLSSDQITVNSLNSPFYEIDANVFMWVGGVRFLIGAIDVFLLVPV
jgi:hypothetical protein